MAARNRKPKRPLAERRGPAADAADSIEEELLASYLAGTLTTKQRAEVARYLAASPEALEVLSMAFEAMQAERRSRQ